MLLVRMAAKSEARPLFGSLRLFYLKMPGRANSIDLEVPGGDKSKEKKYFNVTPSSKADVGDVSVSEGSWRTAQTKRETNRRCHWKIQI